MKTIPLWNKGVVVDYAHVDDIDYDYLTEWHWNLYRDKSGNHYALRWEWHQGKTLNIRLHRLVLERKLGRSLVKGELPDHKNGDGLDNARDNLRLASHALNTINNRKRRAGQTTSPYHGLSWYKRKWLVRIKVHGVDKHLGYYADITDAARVYDDACCILGDSSATNVAQGRLLPLPLDLMPTESV